MCCDVLGCACCPGSRTLLIAAMSEDWCAGDALSSLASCPDRPGTGRLTFPSLSRTELSCLRSAALISVFCGACWHSSFCVLCRSGPASPVCVSRSNITANAMRLVWHPVDYFCVRHCGHGVARRGLICFCCRPSVARLVLFPCRLSACS